MADAVASQPSAGSPGCIAVLARSSAHGRYGGIAAAGANNHRMHRGPLCVNPEVTSLLVCLSGTAAIACVLIRNHRTLLTSGLTHKDLLNVRIGTQARPDTRIGTQARLKRPDQHAKAWQTSELATSASNVRVGTRGLARRPD